MSAAFGILSRRVTANVLRPDAISGGKRGALTTIYTGVSFTPFDPADPEMQARLGLHGPVELLATFVPEGVEVRNGDYLQTRTERYAVRGVGDYTEFNGERFQQVLLEQFKQ